MLSEGPAVGDTFTWGEIGAHADYRSPGDIKFVRDGGLAVGDLVLVRERITAKRTYFVGLMKVIAVHDDFPNHGVYVPEYQMIERFNGSATLDQLRAAHPAVGALPHFQRNAKGFMLRSFSPLAKPELTLLVNAVRGSMK